MSKQRYIRDSFWTDPYVETLGVEEKLLFLYLLTNPLCNVAGIYEVSDRRISMETGVEIGTVQKALEGFIRDKKILRKDNWLVIVNFGKNQSINTNMEKGVLRIMDELPDDIKALKGFETISYFTLLNFTCSTAPNGAGVKSGIQIGEETYSSDELKV